MSTRAPAAFLEDLINACGMESTFRSPMAERDLLFHDTVAPHLAAYAPEASAAQQRDFPTILPPPVSTAARWRKTILLMSPKWSGSAAGHNAD